MKLILVICLIPCVTWTAQISESAKQWHDWFAEGEALNKAARFSAAIKAYQHALTLTETSSGRYLELVKTLDALAGAYVDIGQVADAQRYYRRSLAVMESNEGKGSLAYAVVLASLSTTFEQGRVTEETLNVLREAIRVHGAAAGATDIAVLNDYLSQVLMDRSRFAEAETLLLALQKNLAKREAVDPTLTCVALNNLGRLRYMQKRYQESVDFYIDSLRIGQSVYSENHPTLNLLQNNLAMSYFKMGRLEDAERLMQKATSTCREVNGESNVTCGLLLPSYSVVLRKLGRKRDAKLIEARRRQVLQASRRRNGLDSTIDISDLLSRQH